MYGFGTWEDVPNNLGHCIFLTVMYNAEIKSAQIKHQKGAKVLLTT